MSLTTNNNNTNNNNSNDSLTKDGKKVVRILNQMETEFDKELGLQLYTLGFTAGRRYGDVDLQQSS